jgi:hypothetical protein
VRLLDSDTVPLFELCLDLDRADDKVISLPWEHLRIPAELWDDGGGSRSLQRDLDVAIDRIVQTQPARRVAKGRGALDVYVHTVLSGDDQLIRAIESELQGLSDERAVGSPRALVGHQVVPHGTWSNLREDLRAHNVISMVCRLSARGSDIVVDLSATAAGGRREVRSATLRELFSLASQSTNPLELFVLEVLPQEDSAVAAAQTHGATLHLARDLAKGFSCPVIAACHTQALQSLSGEDSRHQTLTGEVVACALDGKEPRLFGQLVDERIRDRLETVSTPVVYIPSPVAGTPGDGVRHPRIGARTRPPSARPRS